MKKLFFTCGLPKSGKTTFRNKFIGYVKEFVVVSADELRMQIYGQRFFQNGENYVWAVRETLLRTLMCQNVNIFIDETNITIENRRNIVKLCREYKYNASCIYINTSKDICIQRANETNDTIILPIIENMYNRFEKPNESEGFRISIENSRDYFNNIDIYTIVDNIDKF